MTNPVHAVGLKNPPVAAVVIAVVAEAAVTVTGDLVRVVVIAIVGLVRTVTVTVARAATARRVIRKLPALPVRADLAKSIVIVTVDVILVARPARDKIVISVPVDRTDRARNTRAARVETARVRKDKAVAPTTINAVIKATADQTVISRARVLSRPAEANPEHPRRPQGLAKRYRDFSRSYSDLKSRSRPKRAAYCSVHSKLLTI